MYLESLELADFRNYTEVQVALGAGCFVLAGNNAQGKSNLCEAVRLLATMRSFRASSDRELVRWGSPNHFARIRGTIHQAAGPLKLEVIISAPPLLGDLFAPEGVPLPPPPTTGGTHKTVLVNGAPRRPLDVVGLVTVVLFEPADLDLVSGSPQGRRHFMDVTLCQISRSYCKALSQLQKILTQRAALLRRIRDHEDDSRSLDYWDAQLALQAVPIIMERANLIARCTPPADEVARQLGAKGLLLNYLPSFPIATEMAAEDARAAFLARLVSLRRRELLQGVNLLGPHRDDLGFFEGPVDLGVFGSRGQQRTAALALKLAELEAMEAETGDQPILVLDDVLSELDPTRQAALLERVRQNPQVLLSTAEPDMLPREFIRAATVLSIAEGRITRQ